jgi:Asp-tRNA(Asn)/Glu-tRNA(Gln) amidotransferase A subunit family amidase
MAIEAGVAEALERLEAVDPEIHAFVDEPHRRARLEASAPAPGPLHGVPVAVKDLYRVDGLPTRAGSRLPASAFEGAESLVVTKIKDAGAVVLGKTHLDEFAYCEPPPTVNPRDHRRTPGGSSGGSAAAVAAGICRLGIGSQTLQSVIVPASYCGVVGLKLTHGRLPFDGIPLAPSIDSIGFLTPSVADARLAAAALVPEWNDAGPPSRPVLGTLAPWGDPSRTAEGWRACETHLRRVGTLGFELAPASVPWNDPELLPEWGGRVGDLLHGEMAQAHAPWIDRFTEDYRPRTVRAVRHGQTIPQERIDECREGCAELAAMLRDAAARDGVDGWICPSTPGVAPIGYEVTGDSTMTGLWSFAGFPAISLPVFDGPEGLPLGVQLVAPPGRDELLLDWAALVEAALAHDGPPPNAP